MTPDKKKDILDILGGLLTADHYELYLWLKWLSEKISCSDCIELKKRHGKIPDCYKDCIPARNLIKSRCFKNSTGKKENHKNVIQIKK